MKKSNYQLPFTSSVKGATFRFDQNKFEDKYRSMIMNAAQAFLVTAADGNILESNPAASSMFGYSAAQFKKLKRSELVEQPSSLGWQPASTTEATGIKSNGERFPLEIAVATFTDAVGECSSIMLTDISQRKNAEAAMQLSNERFNLVMKATNYLVWDWDLTSGEIYRSSNNLMDVYGHSSNERIRKISDWSAFIHPHDKEKLLSDIEYYTHSATENTFNFEYRFRKEDGSYVFINDKGHIIRNAAGKAIRMIGAAEDITERKQIALAVEESEQRYKMFVQQSTEGIWRIELAEAMHINTPMEEMIAYCYEHCYVAECNDAFAQLYGYDNAAAIIGCPLNKLMAEDNESNMAFLLKFFSNRFVVRDEVSYELDKDGNQLIFLNNMVGIIEGEYIKRAWGSQRNITEQVALQNSLNEERAIRQQQVTEAVIAGQEKERTELGQELHDNINQILASTKMYIECALRDSKPRLDLIAESKALLEKAMHEIRSLSKTLLPPSMEQGGLSTALHELVENINEVNALSIDLDWNLQEGRKISSCLELTIFRIVQEQVNNIIKHAKASNVFISISEINNQVALKIVDNGIGFDTEQKRKGVGLRNISSRAQMNRGEVIIRSAPGTGCEVSVLFPAEPAAGSSASQS